MRFAKPPIAVRHYKCRTEFMLEFLEELCYKPFEMTIIILIHHGLQTRASNAIIENIIIHLKTNALALTAVEIPSRSQNEMDCNVRQEIASKKINKPNVNT